MPARQHSIAVTASTFTGDLRSTALASRKLGFEGLVFDAFSPALDLTQLSQSGRREVRQILSSFNQHFVALQVDLGVKGLGIGADIDRILSQMDRVLETAAGFAAGLVCIELGLLPEPSIAPPPRPKINPAQAGLILIPDLDEIKVQVAQPASPEPAPALVAQVQDALTEVGRRADRYSVMIAFRTALSSFNALHDALGRANCPWFGIDLDPSLMLSDTFSDDDIFSILGGQVRHVRIRDALRGGSGRTKAAAIGRGDVVWDKFLADLEGAGYRGWLTVDPVELPDRIAAAQGARAHLANMI